MNSEGLERAYVKAAYVHHGRNYAATAGALQVGPGQLRNRIATLGVYREVMQGR